MCLTINHNFHKDLKTPIWADKPFTVFKVLVAKPVDWCRLNLTPDPVIHTEDDFFYTPYMMKSIVFIDGKCHLRADQTMLPNGNIITHGIHAYTDLRTANFNLKKGKFGSKEMVAKATVPRGAMFYIGCNDDIVASEMYIENDFYLADIDDTEYTFKKYWGERTSNEPTEDVEEGIIKDLVRKFRDSVSSTTKAWKPTATQLEALVAAADAATSMNSPWIKDLTGLLSDLKKLAKSHDTVADV